MTMNHALQGAPDEGGAPFQASHKLYVELNRFAVGVMSSFP